MEFYIVEKCNDFNHRVTAVRWFESEAEALDFAGYLMADDLREGICRTFYRVVETDDLEAYTAMDGARRWLTTSQAAELAGVSVQRVSKLVADGRLHRAEDGRISQAEVEEWMAAPKSKGGRPRKN